MNEKRRFNLSIPLPDGRGVGRIAHWLIPNGGTLILLALFFFAQTAGAIPLPARQNALAWPSANTINYQGRLADSGGTPLNDTVTLQFAFYDGDVGGSLLWGPETHANVPVSDGLFSVALGSQTSGGVPTDVLAGDIWLEIAVDSETLSPREKLGAVPYAMQAIRAVQADQALQADNLIAQEIADVKGASGGIEIHDVDGRTLRIDGNEIDGTHELHLQREHGVVHMYKMLYLHDASDVTTNAAGIHIGDMDGNTMRLDGNEIDSTDGLHLQREHPAEEVRAYGNLRVDGNLIGGAFVEANLQTPSELATERIDRFSEGDVLCWGEEQLELCQQLGDPLVQAIADENGKPIVVGAEVIKVVGSVRTGDLLIASDVPGYAVVDDDPAPGTVIAQALEDFDGEHGLIRAMIRKF